MNERVVGSAPLSSSSTTQSTCLYLQVGPVVRNSQSDAGRPGLSKHLACAAGMLDIACKVVLGIAREGISKGWALSIKVEHSPCVAACRRHQHRPL